MAAKDRADYPFFKTPERQFISPVRQRNVANLFRESGTGFHIVLHKLPDFGLIRGLPVYIDEYRSGQRLVSPLEHIIILGEYRSLAIAIILIINRHQFQSVLIVLIVCHTKESQCKDICGDPLDQDIVIFTGGIIPPARPPFADDGLCEIIEGAGIDPRSEEMNLLVRPAGTDLAPLSHLPLGSGLPDLL